MAMPPYLPGTIDPNLWTGPTASQQEIQINPASYASIVSGSPSIVTQGGSFSGGIYTSPANWSPTLTYIQVFPPQTNRRYKLSMRIRKIANDNGIGSYIKPGFGLFNGTSGGTYTYNGGVPFYQGITGSGSLGYTSSGNGMFNTASWVLGQWYTIEGYWDTANTSATLLRIRCRFNRDLIGNASNGSNSSARYEVSEFRFFPEVRMSDIEKEFGPNRGAANPNTTTRLSNYYRGGYYVNNNGTNSRIPTSGPIKFSDFLGGAWSAVPPIWNTPAGSLGSALEGTPVSVGVSATHLNGGGTSYSIVSGSLPAGLSLNSSTGLISGTLSNVGADTVSTFTIRATATSYGVFSDRTFSYTTTNFVFVPDVTPDPVNWTDSFASGPTNDSFIPGVSVGGNTNNQTITGINVPITLRATCSRPLNAGENLAAYVNGSLYAEEMTIGESTMDVTVNNGDVVLFRFGGFYTTTVTFTITNTSDGNAILDTFNSTVVKTN